MKRGLALGALLALGGSNAAALAPEEGLVHAGLGGGAFTGGMGEVTSGGLAWNVRAGVGFNPLLGAELAYQGMSNGVVTIAQSGGGTVLRNEDVVQTTLSANAVAGVPFLLQNDHTVRPYALVGLGWARLGSNDQLGAAGLGTDSQLAVPLGAGVSYDLAENVLLDGRFTWSFLPGLDVPLAADDGSAWTAVVTLGARFGL